MPVVRNYFIGQQSRKRGNLQDIVSSIYTKHPVCPHCEKPFSHEDITLSIAEDKPRSVISVRR
jgi:hypothetical protein